MNEVIKPIRGVVFNIQKFSVHDGPGIRTIVFLKGCPLSCLWCDNPEGQYSQPELVYNENRCIGTLECGECLKVCKAEAILEVEKNNKVLINNWKCLKCDECTQVCPSMALEMMGKNMTPEDVLKIVEEDAIFYSRSGGGLTLSGGEPLFQADFCCEILKQAKEKGLHTAIETSGYADWNSMENVIRFIDFIIYDIKSMNSDIHRRFTGVSNEIIISNLTRLCQKFSKRPVMVRTPVIPGFNDSEEDIIAIKDFVGRFHNVVDYELLIYHRLGEPKYGYLHRNYPMKGVLPPTKERIERLKQLVIQPQEGVLNNIRFSIKDQVEG